MNSSPSVFRFGFRLAAAMVAAAVLACPLAAREGAHPTDQRIAELIEQLGDRNYFVRQRAQDELAKLGFEAFDALSQAQHHDDFEIRARARYLIRSLSANLTEESDPPQVKQYLQNYEWQPPETRAGAIEKLAVLPDGGGVPALCRLVRFEKSDLLSKQAAVEIIRPAQRIRPPTLQLAEILGKNLGRSRRPGAQWLRTYARFAEDPAAAIDEWNRIAEAEYDVFRRSPGLSDSKFILAMLKVQFAWLDTLGRDEEAVANVRRQLAMLHDHPEEFVHLIDSLLERKAWGAMDEAAARFERLFRRQPLLMYILAQSYLQRGRDDKARQIAEEARGLNPGDDEVALREHVATAGELQERGWFDWAEGEYRYVIEAGAEDHRKLLQARCCLTAMDLQPYRSLDILRQPLLEGIETGGAELAEVARAGNYLARMFHDQGDPSAAAEAMAPVVELLALMGIPPQSAFRQAACSSLPYYRACHYAETGDHARQRAALEKALQVDPDQVDVLIALYRLPDQTPQQRREILDSIEQTTDRFQRLIGSNPDYPMYYNQLAWLIGNTEGDLDQALAYSKKSVELAPESSAYHDTLGRVHYARGEYEEALKAQSTALELEPHSGLMRKQYEMIQEALRQHRKKDPEEAGDTPPSPD